MNDRPTNAAPLNSKRVRTFATCGSTKTVNRLTYARRNKQKMKVLPFHWVDSI